MLSKLRYISLMLLVAALQVGVLNHIHLWGYAMPLITPLAVLFLPINEGRISSMLTLFGFGLVLDLLSGTPGQNSAALTLCGMMRPLLLRLTLPKEHVEDMVPTTTTMGRWGHFVLLLLAAFIHITVFFVLESMNYLSSLDFLITYASSFVLSVALMMALDSLRGRKPLENE